MEPRSATKNHNFSGGSSHSIPPGRILYVMPLRMMPPSGGQPFFPPQNPQAPFNGFRTDMFRYRMHRESYVQQKPSVVRDFAEETMPESSTARDFSVRAGRDANAQNTSSGNAYPDQQVNPKKSSTVHSPAADQNTEPAEATDTALRNDKRNNTSSPPSDSKKAKRSGEKPSKSISTGVEASGCADPRKA
eukprot:c5250_g2_i1 orf=41-610(+)